MEETVPILNHFEKLGKVKKISSEPPVDEVLAMLLTCMKLGI